jgi:hypothetical protein
MLAKLKIPPLPPIPPVPPFLWPWLPTFHAPCNDPRTEFRSVEIVANSTDRLASAAVQPAKNGNAMRIEVRDGDFASNPAGGLIQGGWRAEAIGPEEQESTAPVHYMWSTMLPQDYPQDPEDAAGKAIWQVVFQWHQAYENAGVEPPVAFIIVHDEIRLDLHRCQPGDDPAKSVPVGQWPVATLDRGTWHDFQAEILWHPSNGSIRVWRNGVPVTFQPRVHPDLPATTAPFPATATTTISGIGTLYQPKPGSQQPSSTYMKVGLYRKAAATTPPGPYVLFHDEVWRWVPNPRYQSLVSLIRRIRVPRWFPKVPFPDPPPQ